VGYAAGWGLFRDWCAAAGQSALPAPVYTLIDFLDDNPVAPATWARRVAAITHMHGVGGYASPGWDPTVGNLIRAAAGKPALDLEPRRMPVGQVAELVRRIPSAGCDGSRRPVGRPGCSAAATPAYCCFLRPQVAPIPSATSCVRTTSSDGGLTIRTGTADGPVRLPAAGAGVCPGCVWRRWANVLSFIHRYPSHRSLRTAFDRRPPDVRVHVCRTPPAGDVPVGPVFLPVDRYGYLEAHRPLSVRSISRITRAHLAGTPPTYRHLDPPPSPPADPLPASPPLSPPARYAPTTRRPSTGNVPTGPGSPS